MTHETSPSARRQAVLQRARQRQALIRQRTPDDILDFEQRLFAEDEQYVAELLRANTEAERLPEPLPQSRPSPKSLDPLPTPAPSSAYGQEGQAPEALSEFERQHNALRLYIFEQFAAGMKSREIAAMIGLSPNKITRWYNQVKDQPPIARLWTPLLNETDVQKWQKR